MSSDGKPELIDSGAEIIMQHLEECTAAKAAVVVDGSADDLIASMTAAGWVLDERVDHIAGKRIRFLSVPYQRACCDHCNNGEGDPAGHDYTLDGPHDRPCEECAVEQRHADFLLERNR